jgi:pimeloyl-ACP methyl ester carboxylesterase
MPLLLLGCIQSSQETTQNVSTGPSVPPTATPPATQPAQNVSAPQNVTPSAPPPATSTLKSKNITFTSLNWNIHGTLYDSSERTPKKVVMLLPMLGKTRESYPQNIIERIHTEIPDAMVFALDMRGHGKSTNMGTYQSFSKSDYNEMKLDIINARKYFDANHPSVEKYYVIGASIGSTAAISAGAMDKYISKVAMLSPGMEYKGVDIESDVDDYEKDLLIVAASGDTYSYSSATEIDELSSARKTLKIYSGSSHGTDLFDATKDDSEPLSDVLMKFLKK